jgi:hypothetical protein
MIENILSMYCARIRAMRIQIHTDNGQLDDSTFSISDKTESATILQSPYSPDHASCDLFLDTRENNEKKGIPHRKRYEIGDMTNSESNASENFIQARIRRSNLPPPIIPKYSPAM